jgi:DNA excision repair protein ERCC-3
MQFFGDQLQLAMSALAQAEQSIADARRRAADLAESYYPQVDTNAFRQFIRKPYVLIPKGGAQWYCIVPRFVDDFSVGWLEFTTDSYNVFLINRYTLWLGQVPEEIRAATGLEKPPGDLMIADGNLVYPKEDRPAAEKYRKHFVSNRVGQTGSRIIKGREFQLLAEMVDDGYLPFAPRPVAQSDRRTPDGCKFGFEGKYEFQRGAYGTFMQTGAVGVYWMTSAGKSFLAMAVADSIVGRKLLIVPTRTLIEQWTGYFRQYCPRIQREFDLITYSSYEKVSRNEYALTIFDECHRLPANSFSRLATIKTKYRLGLSASPYREDGRTNYIFALTGWPIGMDWRSMIKLLGKNYHAVNIWIVASEAGKLTKVAELLSPGIKTIIFCDSLGLGQKVADRFGLPFIHGGTSKRMEIAQQSTAFVASRVMDMGASLEGLEQIIEIDFLFGSRQQEVQRTGRLFHSEKNARHDVVMTREEFDSYHKRFHGLVEQGFKINVHQ